MVTMAADIGINNNLALIMSGAAFVSIIVGIFVKVIIDVVALWRGGDRLVEDQEFDAEWEEAFGEEGE